MVSLEKRKPVSLTKEQAPQKPEMAAEIPDERSIEERLQAVTDKLHEDVVYSDKESDEAALSNWEQRSKEGDADALRRTLAAKRDELAVLPVGMNLSADTQAPIHDELRAYLKQGDNYIANTQVRESHNISLREASHKELQKADTKRKLKNIFSLGIGAKGRNLRHQAATQRVESYHIGVAQELANNRQVTRQRQMDAIALQRATLEADIRSTELSANARESAANLSDETFQEDFDEVEARLTASIDRSRQDGTLKQEEVIAQLQSSSEYANATPEEQKELMDRCNNLVQEAITAEVELTQATEGMKLKKLVQNRISSRSPAGSKLEMSKFNAAANWHAAGGWEEGWKPGRVDALANELVKFGLDREGVTIATLPPETITQIALAEMQKIREAHQQT